MENILITNGITKKFKNNLVVNNVDMHINKGDIYGFIGENGAGKTTIIRLITGLISPTEGDYTLFGINSNDHNIYEAKKRISAVVEAPSLYPNMNARDNMLQQCCLLGVTDLSCVDSILDLVGLKEQKNSKKLVKNYSLGMRQRLAIGITLVGGTDFIILDEPMNGLDPEGIVDIRELIIKLNREENITFLISSHILDELSKMATKYGFIHNGELIKELTSEELSHECKKCIEIKVKEMALLPIILEEMKITNYKFLQNNIIRIYDEVDLNDLLSKLINSNTIIEKINTKDESIEEFYLNTMGGLKNA